MIRQTTTWFIFLLMTGLVAALTSKQNQSGIIVERVAKNSEGERAGLREGDVLLNWTRGDARGQIDSPFDLPDLEIEQAPKGTVTLQGLRDSQARSWTLGQTSWGVRTRPSLPEGLRPIYRDAEELANAGKPDEAAERCRVAALMAHSSHLSGLAPWLLFRSADLLASAKQWKAANDTYRQAIEWTVEAGPVRAHMLRIWARSFQQRHDWTNAEKYYQQSVDEARKASAVNLNIAASLNNLGSVGWEKGDLEMAESYYRQALSIRQQLAPGSLDVAQSFGNLGLVSWQRGDLAKAEEYQRQGLAIKEKLVPGSSSMAVTLNNLGTILESRGDLAKAEEYHLQALGIREKLGQDSRDVAGSLVNLGGLAQDRGDLSAAEKYFRRALTIQEKLSPGTHELAITLSNLGTVAGQRGDLARAEEYHQQALAIDQKLSPDTLEVASHLNDLGIVAQLRDDLARAHEYYHQALTIEQKYAPGSLSLADTLVNLGNLARKRGDLPAAEDYHLQALAIRENLAPAGLDTAASLNNLGDVARERSQPVKAEGYFRRALAINEKMAPGSIFHAESLAGVGSLLQHKGQLDAAATYLGQAVDALENQTQRLGGPEEVRSLFRANHAGFYDDYMELLITQDQPAAAFQVLERSRARSLLELLAEGRVDVRKDGDASLLEQESSLRQLLNAKSDRRLRMLSGKPTAKQLEDAGKEIEQLLSKYQEVEGQIWTSSPDYAALTQPRPLSVAQVQQQLLDAHTLLLEYALGEEHSHLWAVGPSLVAIYELPKRSEVETLARQLYDVVTAKNQKNHEEAGRTRRSRGTKVEAEYAAAASRLSRMLLGPVAAQLKENRLLIVSDGALQYIPFAMLPSPEKPSVPLIAEHEIVNLPSATTLAVLRHQLSGRRSPGKSVAIIADPVFDRNDDRLAAPENHLPGHQFQTSRSVSRVIEENGTISSARDVGISGDGSFPRLPFSRREAEAIFSIARQGDVTKILDFDATKSAAMNPQLRDYRVVHFATHGLLNNRHPELSGLVFSLVNRQGEAQDGFLRLLDIYNLDLNADLVVLSACQTALGKQIRQEGLVGLTRGFMYAGAARVLASLWNADDEATAALMKKFYEGILKNRQTPAQALRAAQIWVLEQKPWKSPYYWAGFVLQGEWR
jgi:CHAT domain-containing protein/Tfp pilus assembly protein PilF